MGDLSRGQVESEPSPAELEPDRPPAELPVETRKPVPE